MGVLLRLVFDVALKTIKSYGKSSELQNLPKLTDNDKKIQNKFRSNHFL